MPTGKVERDTYIKDSAEGAVHPSLTELSKPLAQLAKQIAFFIPFLVAADFISRGVNNNWVDTPKNTLRTIGLSSYILGLPAVYNATYESFGGTWGLGAAELHLYKYITMPATNRILEEAAAVTASDVVPDALAVAAITHTQTPVVTAPEVAQGLPAAEASLETELGVNAAVAGGEASEAIWQTALALKNAALRTEIMSITFGLGDIFIGVGQVWGGAIKIEGGHATRGGFSVAARSSSIIAGLALFGGALIGFGVTLPVSATVLAGVVAVATISSLGFGIAAVFSTT